MQELRVGLAHFTGDRLAGYDYEDEGMGLGSNKERRRR